MARENKGASVIKRWINKTCPFSILGVAITGRHGSVSTGDLALLVLSGKEFEL